MAFDLVVAPMIEPLYGSYTEEELPSSPMVRVCGAGTERVMKYSVYVESFPVFSLGGEQANVYVSHPCIHQCLHSFRFVIHSVLFLLPVYLFISLFPSLFLFCLTAFYHC
jgi:hypothetical protein